MSASGEALKALIAAIDGEISPLGFRPHSHERMPSLGCVAYWCLRTWSINRAAAVLTAPEDDFEIGPYCQRMKWQLRKLKWSVPFFYEPGLQIVLYGDGLERKLGVTGRLSGQIDTYSNQLVVLQSIFVVDPGTRRYTVERTWGQVVTGQYQDAIAVGIHRAGYTSIVPGLEGRDPTERLRADAPSESIKKGGHDIQG
jgi:hypothetical protein